jgi:hypothetical protein
LIPKANEKAALAEDIGKRDSIDALNCTTSVASDSGIDVSTPQIVSQQQIWPR